MRRCLLWLLAAALVLLTACAAPVAQPQSDFSETPQIGEDTGSVDSAGKNPDSDEREEADMERLKMETAVIRMRDRVEQQFEDSLELTLTAQQTEALCAAMGTLQPKDTPYGGYVMYARDFFERDGKLIDSLLVDNDVTLELSAGEAFRRAGETDKVLSELEKHFGIRASLYTRRPGAGYFNLFSQVDRGYLYEVTANNFIKGLTLDLDREKIDALATALSDASHSEERLPQVKAKYIAELYSRGGGLVYRFSFDEQGHVYGMENYEILNSALADWLAECIG